MTEKTVIEVLVKGNWVELISIDFDEKQEVTDLDKENVVKGMIDMLYKTEKCQFTSGEGKDMVGVCLKNTDSEFNVFRVRII